jgi:hypothetical protein
VGAGQATNDGKQGEFIARCKLVVALVGTHQENVIYYGTLQTTTEHYVVLCSKIQPTDAVVSVGSSRQAECC